VAGVQQKADSLEANIGGIIGLNAALKDELKVAKAQGDDNKAELAAVKAQLEFVTRQLAYHCNRLSHLEMLVQNLLVNGQIQHAQIGAIEMYQATAVATKEEVEVVATAERALANANNVQVKAELAGLAELVAEHAAEPYPTIVSEGSDC